MLGYLRKLEKAAALSGVFMGAPEENQAVLQGVAFMGVQVFR